MLRHKNTTEETEKTGTHRQPEVTADDTTARDKFGGVNVGAAFFGWLVAMGVAILLIGIAGAGAATVGEAMEVTQSDAEPDAGTIGVTAAIVLLVVLLVSYYAGGYVAGRMSRFDGARQGVGVWFLGLVVTLLAAGVGAVFGSEYNVLDRVDLPRIPFSPEELGWAGVVTAVAAVLITLAGAALGGLAGHRYHNRVDAAVRQD